MLKESVLKALNDQVRAEFHSAYLYLSMSAWCTARNFPGFAHWMRMQAQEEMFHALKIFDYIHMTGGHAELQAVPQPATDWADPAAVFQAALAHERKMTGSISELVGLTMKENDYATAAMLQWFVGEQVEEESTVETILGQLELMGGDGQGLFMLDRELGSRAAPTAPAEA